MKSLADPNTSLFFLLLLSLSKFSVYLLIESTIPVLESYIITY